MASSSTASGSSQVSLDSVLGEITTTQDDVQLNNVLRNYATKETREMIYASFLAGGQDPLSVLDVQNNTLGYLYLLSARLTVTNAPIPPLQAIQTFCADFDPVKARLAPERVTLLAKGIVALYETAATLDQCLPLLLDLLTRFPPSRAHLTPLHAPFLRACVATRRFAAALPVLTAPVTEVAPALFPDLHYNDHLVYHYAGALALAALRRWAAAEEFLELVVGAPAQAPAAIQLEALKKLALVQLIVYGKVKDVPKYVSATLVSIFKKSPYGAFVNAYPLQTAQLERILEKEAGAFDSDKNLGLVRQAMERARRWAIKKLTETYITLSLAEIGDAVNLPDQEAVRAIVVSMIEDDEIVGSIDADGTVTFDDASLESSVSQAQVDALLAAAQHQGAVLAELDRKLGRSREFLSKSVKNRDNGDWSQVMDDDMYAKSQGEGWTEESLF
ncbi:hypothetical protein DFH11DRAFT_1876551 [Phellopilus nigrolimitatus]|nr:hypothetical protein DFH11DRAFT_1876551 [Phellopilus nigrolimitatus]